MAKSMNGASGLNLHAVVRSLIGALHPEVAARLHRSIGRSAGTDGSLKSVYAPGVLISAQRQSAGPARLSQRDLVSETEIACKFYLSADPDPAGQVAGIYRPLSRGGDMFQLADGSWWLVTELLEDFSRSGWACVRAVLQVNPPDFSHSSRPQQAAAGKGGSHD
jgi:hypothetical protein